MMNDDSVANIAGHANRQARSNDNMPYPRTESRIKLKEDQI